MQGGLIPLQGDDKFHPASLAPFFEASAVVLKHAVRESDELVQRANNLVRLGRIRLHHLDCAEQERIPMQLRGTRVVSWWSVSYKASARGEAPGVSKRLPTSPTSSAVWTSRAPQAQSSLWSLDDPGYNQGSTEHEIGEFGRPKEQRWVPFRSVEFVPVSI